MGLVILGAGIMLLGVLVGYGIHSSTKVSTEEIAKWEQEIEEINKEDK